MDLTKYGAKMIRNVKQKKQITKTRRKKNYFWFFWIETFWTSKIYVQTSKYCSHLSWVKKWMSSPAELLKWSNKIKRHVLKIKFYMCTCITFTCDTVTSLYNMYLYTTLECNSCLKVSRVSFSTDTCTFTLFAHKYYKHINIHYINMF